MKENRKSAFTPQEERELARLLKKIPENGGFIPDPAFFPFHACTSVWAPELVICRGEETKTPEVLLIPYEGGESYWAENHYYHLPGGYHKHPDNKRIRVGMLYDHGGFQSVQGAASRIALRELNMDVELISLLDIYWWLSPTKSGWKEDSGEHPHGLPLSIFLKCETIGKLEESEKIKFFPVTHLPSPLVIPHKWFLEWHFLHKPFPV